MNLADIGEEVLIEHLMKEFSLPTSSEGLVVGVGDDAAVLDLGGPMLTIITTDMLAEGIHYRLDLVTPYELGWKSVASNISDIAAMGGLPTWTLISLGLKPDTDIGFVDEIYRGLVECAERFESKIIGGDTISVRQDSVIGICQMGKIEPNLIARRSGASPGDRILVTGWLGNSRAGLELLLRFGTEEAAQLHGWLVGQHLTPIPRVLEAHAAVATNAIRAMMDISDGLGADLPKLCKASGVGAIVYASKLPISSDLQSAAERLGMDTLELVAGGGEDFELLMAVRPHDVKKVIKAIKEGTGTRVTEIGEFTEDKTVEIVMPDGSRRPLWAGWEHFKR
ncbi:MAG: thiamine-phosphate kinase [Armatimonadetes bacterium]|nr:thiamine-phosphate kinase [Armatimonadota bacterium]